MAKPKKKPLPKQNNTKPRRGESAPNTVSSVMTDTIATAVMIGNKALADSISLLSSYLYQELPDLAVVGGYFSDYLKDFLGDKGKKTELKKNDSQREDIRIIKKEELSHTDIFDVMISELKDIGNVLESLTKVTSDVWGINRDQLDQIKEQTKTLKEEERLRKFEVQKSKHKERSTFNRLVQPTQVKKNSVLKDIATILLRNSIVNTLASLIGTVIEGIMVASLGGKIVKNILKTGTGKLIKKTAPKLFDRLFGKDEESPFKKATNKKPSNFKRISKVTSKGVKTIGRGVSAIGRMGMAAATSTIGSTTLVGAAGLAAGTAAGYYGLQGISDAVDSLTGKENVIGTWLMNMVDGIKKIFTADFWTNKIDSLSSSIKDSLTNLVNDLEDRFMKLKDGLITSFTDNIRALLQKIIPEGGKINILGKDVRVAPDSLVDFVYPKTTSLEPASTQENKAINILSAQQSVDDKQLNRRSELGSVNAVNQTNIAPVNNIFNSTPITTRNPDPIFGNYLSF